MKLSIIIPVYRVEDTLDRCLQSVTTQSFSDFELILVDDGSPDRCPQLCDDWARRDRRISVIHQPNGGLSQARNAGIDAATGELITFVDSDDFLAPDTYRQVLPLSDSADIVEFPLVRFHGSPRQQHVAFGSHVYRSASAYWLQGRAYEHCYVWNKVFRRQLFSHDLRFEPHRVFEDVELMPRLLRRAATVVTADAGCYYYCANPRGITATATGPQLSQLLDAHQQTLQHWADDRYYMHVLNIQLDVCRLGGQPPTLPLRRVSPLARGLTATQRVKALLLNTIGLELLCKINNKTHRS